MAAKSFDQLVAEAKDRHIEALALGGDFPECTPRHSCDQDWQHILIEDIATLFEYCRLDDADPKQVKLKRAALAKIAALCRAWDAKIRREK